MKCLKITLVAVLLIPAWADGQIKIVAQTISGPYCRYVGGMENGQLIIDSGDKYDEMEFRDLYDDPCLPFDDIDFSKNILVGFGFRGSSCDTQIEWSRLLRQENRYLIQFRTGPNHVCRDFRIGFAWFVIEMPIGEFEIAFERL